MLPRHKEGAITALGGREPPGRLSQELALRLNLLCHSGAVEQVGRKPASLLYRAIIVLNRALAEDKIHCGDKQSRPCLAPQHEYL